MCLICCEFGFVGFELWCLRVGLPILKLGLVVDLFW